jgi:SpoVK/Ycf46/Vps4 family AAA+-type ATPase
MPFLSNFLSDLLLDIIRLITPCTLICEQVDALAAKRGEPGGGGGGDASVRLLSTLLTEMDGMELATGGSASVSS